MKLIVIENRGDSKMVHYHYRVIFFAIVIILFTASLGVSKQYENQSILSESKIKKKSFKKGIVRRIKKTLSKELRKCPVVITNIKLFRAADEFNVDEEWTVDICQEIKVYFVSTSTWPKGYWIDSVELKKERIAREKKILNVAKKLGTEEAWRDDLFYIDEIEAINHNEKEK